MWMRTFNRNNRTINLFPTTFRMKRIFTAIIVSLLAMPSTALGQKIVFTPQWTAQSQFAGYYVAQEKGFYKEAGLDVEIVHPSASYSATNRLIEGSSNVITLQLMQAIAEIDKGAELVNILQTSQHNGLVIVSRKGPLESFNDLKRKKVGIWQAGFGELALLADKELGLGIQWIPFIQNVNLFLSGAIDATLAMSYNEYLQIYSSGYDNAPVLRFKEAGFDIPEDGVYVTKDYYSRFPQKMEAFAQASRKGWEWAHAHPAEALEIVLEVMKSEKVPTNRIHQEWMLEEILKLQKDTPHGTATFQFDEEKFGKAVDMMLRHGLIAAPVKPDQMKGGKK